jgi:predicted nucleic acid-binding protein
VTTYVDSSALVPVYVPERFSKAARRALFALLIGRGLISDEEYRAIRALLREDIEAQRLVPLALDWDRVFASACELSENHAAKLLTRSLDLLHVAAAHAASCRVFVSADDRQLAVAKATGLKVVDIKRTGRAAKR